MKNLVVLVLAIVISNTRAEDDGKYRPELYGDKGQYKHISDGRYYYYPENYNGYYGRHIYDPSYYPVYYNTLKPFQHLLAPISKTSEVPQIVVTARPILSTPLPVVAAPAVKYAPVYSKASNENYARIVTQDSDASENGYHYRFLTENGIAAEETGSVASATNGGTRVQGFYEYVGDDGRTYRVDYTADENGFHPKGAHLP